MALEEGDIVLCTVDRIIGTNVFVTLEGGGEGIIITSEIAPGRIRNLRDYVVPKKKIVCKVLRVSGDRIDLSLRRVTQKEQKEVMNEYKNERSYISILKTVLGEEADKTIASISEKGRLYDFIEEARENPKELEKSVGKEKAGKVLEILGTQKKKSFTVKKEILMRTIRPDGAEIIKSLLGKIKDADVRYISAGHYLLKIESSDAKGADNSLRLIAAGIENSAKKEGIEFSIAER